MPFRFNRLASEISASLAEEYRARYGLDIPEWRVMATLGYRSDARSAQYIVHCTRTHKSTISRAVTTLLARKLIVSLRNQDDRREALLQLTPRGRALFDELLPRLLDKEAEMLSCLTAKERKTLAKLLSKLEVDMHLAV